MEVERGITQHVIRGAQDFLWYKSDLICSVSSFEFIILEHNSSVLREV